MMLESSLYESPPEAYRELLQVKVDESIDITLHEPIKTPEVTPISIAQQINLHALETSQTPKHPFLDALEKGLITVNSLDRYATNKLQKNVQFELMPLNKRIKLPEQLCHLTSPEHYDDILEYISADPSVTWGPKTDEWTYLQTTQMNVPTNSQEWAYLAGGGIDEIKALRIYFDTERLLKMRNLYVDPESITTAPTEYLEAFICEHGVPRISATRVDLITVTRRDGNILTSENAGTLDKKSETKKLISKIESELRRNRVPYIDEVE
jgi:hypothetical protein